MDDDDDDDDSLIVGSMLVDLDAAVVFTGRSRDSLRGHHQRGRLRAVGRDGRRGLYSLGDLLPFRLPQGEDDGDGDG